MRKYVAHVVGRVDFFAARDAQSLFISRVLILRSMRMTSLKIHGISAMESRFDGRYCNSCRALRDPPPQCDIRLFEKLVDKMNRMNPVAFHLPKAIRNYFDGVTTGEDGEYQETHEVKPVRANA